ncbi:MAG: hypothetical protein M1818_005547 [Claussenomyces sp. TS43310]|nr:MAG: hypothetical protein M1818_005547 [Claussenomyces sp. TS43310]
MRFLSSLVLLFLFATSTSAWPWPRFLPELDALIVRETSETSATATPASTSGSAEPTRTGSASASQTDSKAPVTSASASTKPDSKTTKSGKSGSSETAATTTSHTTYDARLPAGGVSMITPAVASGAQFYKIGEYVTFAWNYTSLSATPTAINVMASCSTNSELYTIAMNQTVDGPTGAVTWDTGSYQTTAAIPLPVASYTLVIYDAASAVTAVAAAGYLGVYDSYTFGMYTPQPYTPLNEFNCVTCSGALSNMERQALGFMLGMSAITVLSFSWFVGGLNIIW